MVDQPNINRSDIERAVAEVYADAGGAIDNSVLYERVADSVGVQMELFNHRRPIGRSGQAHSVAARDARWAQQTLKIQGLLERVDHGRWRLTAEGRHKLRRPVRGMMLLAFSTDHGIAVWGDCRDVMRGLEDRITLCLTSPVYPIAKGRAYGQIDEHAYVDWLCRVMEPIVARLVPGGNITLVLGNDVFERGSPARSLYLERLTLAFADRFGLSLMDRLIWHNPSKAPGPVRYASIERNQLNSGYEFILWFTNDPQNVIADNRRVLEPHTKRHQRLLAAGGEQRTSSSQDGAHRLRAGASFSRETPGRIPRNVFTHGHRCADQDVYKQAARNLGLPVHGAVAPLALGRKLVRFLCPEGEVVVDPMSGSGTFPRAADLEGRRWCAAEQFGEYLRAQAERFTGSSGYRLNPSFASHFTDTSETAVP